jgi:hypothetical protein
MPTEQETEAPSKPVTKNIMGAALEKFHAVQEAGLAGLQTSEKESPVEKQPPAEKKPDEIQPPPAAGKDDDDETEIDSINVDDIRTKAGLPISENAKQKFKKLEDSRNRWKSKVAEYEKKVSEFEAKLAATNTAAGDIENADEFKKLKEENLKLKESQDLLFFEQSDDWKNTFEKPILGVTERINNIIASAVTTLSQADKTSLGSLLNRANALLGKDDAEVEYDAIVDSITENILTGTAGAKLAKSMQDIWSLALERNKAKADKASAREKITVHQKAIRENSRKSLEELLSLQENAFEKTPVGNALSKTFADKFQYNENKEIGKKVVTEAVDVFMKTGVATPELAEALHHASLKRVHDKEREFLLAGYNAMSEASEKQAEKIKELEKRISELRGGIGERPTKEDKPTKKSGDRPFSLSDRLNSRISEMSR